MTTYINGRFLTQQRSGMQRWAEQVVCALDRRLTASAPPRSYEPIILLHPPQEARTLPLQRVKVRPTGTGRGHYWEQTSLLAASRDGLLLNLLSSGPVLHPRQIVTFHDAAVLRHPELFGRGYRMLHSVLRPLLARRAKALITVSHFSARDLAECMRTSPDRFTIIPNAADHLAQIAPQTAILDRLRLHKNKFALCVGNQTPNKNIATAISAFLLLNRNDLRLVLVGAGNSQVFGNIDIGSHPDVIAAGYVSDGELRALYENAAFFCMPSRYEGFGIPLVEAMRFGCPAIASTAEALREVGGDAALYAAPDDIQGFARAMEQILADGSLAETYRSRGSQRAQQFSWDDSAARLDAVLMQAVRDAA